MAGWWASPRPTPRSSTRGQHGAALDKADQDVGGTAPVLFEVPGATPSKLTLALGKDGIAYFLNRENWGGATRRALATVKVTTGAIINAAVAYTTATETYAVFKNSARASGCPATTN